MAQIRLYIQAEKTVAERHYAVLNEVFEEDFFPLALAEIDEDAALYEISLYIEENEAGTIEIRTIEALGNIVIERETLPDIDWVQHSLEGLKPVRAGRFFVHGSHDRDKCRPADISIEIDAGQAFGTGHHGTTSGCLDMIETVMRRTHPKNILDLGTGSGVLAIAAAKIARVKVLATDIDPIATKVAHGNVRLNGAENSVTTITAIGFDHPEIIRRRPFDLIIANILARPLMQLAPNVRRCLKKGGSVILSGILDSQRKRVLEAYMAQGFHHRSTLHRNGWSTLHLQYGRISSKKSNHSGF